MSELVSTGTDLARLRRLNVLTLVRALRAKGEALTATELAARAGLSRPAVDALVQGLVADGWAGVIEPGASSVVGRPARRYRFRGEAGHVFGLDIGAHKVFGMLSDLSGAVLRTARTSVAPDADPATRLLAADAVLDECLAGAGLAPPDLWSITVGVTGPVDSTGHTSLFTPLPGWDSVQPGDYLSTRFPCPILVENDCKLAAVAERWQGAAQHVDDLVYLLAGLRTGAGLIIDGTLRRGHGGAAGEIGALRVLRWWDAPSHLENYPGGPGGLAPEETARWVFDAARRGERAAQTAVHRYVRDLALGAAALVLTLDPELIVLGGGFSRSADLLIPLLEKEMRKLCLRMPEIAASSLGDESVALGAVRMALDEVESRVFATPDIGTPVPLRR